MIYWEEEVEMYTPEEMDERYDMMEDYDRDE